MHKLRWLVLALLTAAVFVSAGAATMTTAARGRHGGGAPIKSRLTSVTASFKAARPPPGVPGLGGMVNERGLTAPQVRGEKYAIAPEPSCRLQRADQPLQLTCCSSRSPAELPPPRLPSATDALLRAGGGAPGFDAIQVLFFAQQATADKQCSLRTTSPRCRGAASETAAYPTLDDPFAQPTSEGTEGDLPQGPSSARLPRDYTIAKNLDASGARSGPGSPRIVQARLRDGVGMVRALRKAGLPPKTSQTTAPSLATIPGHRSNARDLWGSATPMSPRRPQRGVVAITARCVGDEVPGTFDAYASARCARRPWADGTSRAPASARAADCCVELGRHDLGPELGRSRPPAGRVPGPSGRGRARSSSEESPPRRRSSGCQP